LTRDGHLYLNLNEGLTDGLKVQGQRLAETLSVSLTEWERACVVRQVASGQIGQGEAPERLGIGLRQMKRLMRQRRLPGDAGSVSRQRGHRSNRRLPSGFHTTLEEHLRGQSLDSPERPLPALLIQGFYSVRSERQLMEQVNYSLLFRWFVGLSVDDPVWDPSTFSKNRDGVLNEDFAASFLDAVLNADKINGLVSSEHFPSMAH
jgi:hypothetical protein